MTSTRTASGGVVGYPGNGVVTETVRTHVVPRGTPPGVLIRVLQWAYSGLTVGLQSATVGHSGPQWVWSIKLEKSINFMIFMNFLENTRKIDKFHDFHGFSGK